VFESSQQAQFLKPTVISLCYGLGFGMVLVICLVPALVWVQQDFRVLGRSRRRALGSSRLPIGGKLVVWGAVCASFVVVCLTVGAYAVTGETNTWPLSMVGTARPELSSGAVAAGSLVVGLVSVTLIAMAAVAMGGARQRR